MTHTRLKSTQSIYTTHDRCFLVLPSARSLPAAIWIWAYDDDVYMMLLTTLIWIQRRWFYTSERTTTTEKQSSKHVRAGTIFVCVCSMWVMCCVGYIGWRKWQTRELYLEKVISYSHLLTTNPKNISVRLVLVFVWNNGMQCDIQVYSRQNTTQTRRNTKRATEENMSSMASCGVMLLMLI